MLEVGGPVDDVAGLVFPARHFGGVVHARMRANGAGRVANVWNRNGAWRQTVLLGGSGRIASARIHACFNRPHAGADLTPSLCDLVRATFVEALSANLRYARRPRAVSEDEIARRAG